MRFRPPANHIGGASKMATVAVLGIFVMRARSGE
jgi:hypothetical protein